MAQAIGGAEIFAPGFKEQPYWWEAAAPPEPTAPESYTPARIRVVATEGEHEIAVSL